MIVVGCLDVTILNDFLLNYSLPDFDSWYAVPIRLIFNSDRVIITATWRFPVPNIKPVPDLRNYAEVLKDIRSGSSVFLTKNGRGRYVILDMVVPEHGYSCIGIVI